VFFISAGNRLIICAANKKRWGNRNSHSVLSRHLSTGLGRCRLWAAASTRDCAKAPPYLSCTRPEFTSFHPL